LIFPVSYDIIWLMKISKLTNVLLILFLSFFLSSCTLPFLGKRKKAALQVTADPKATVFLNDEHLSQTPYFDENLKPGEYALKLVPDSSEGSLLPWQGMVKLSPGIMTVVNRTLGKTASDSSGYVLSLEPIAEKDQVIISIISTPDNVVVTLDGEPRGFTPLSLDNISEGEHTLIISSPGFREEIIQAKTAKGHKLVINAQLAEENLEKADEKEDEEATDSANLEEEDSLEDADEETVVDKNNEEEDETEESSSKTMALPYVEIKTTPTGWLNVRSEASTAGGDETILVKIDTGDVFKFIEANEDGWYKIEYEEDKQGWISGTYAKLFQ